MYTTLCAVSQNDVNLRVRVECESSHTSIHAVQLNMPTYTLAYSMDLLILSSVPLLRSVVKFVCLSAV